MRRVQEGHDPRKVVLLIRIGLAVAREPVVVEEVGKAGPCPFPRGKGELRAFLGRKLLEVQEMLAFVQCNGPRSFLGQRAVKALGGGPRQYVGNVDAAIGTEALPESHPIERRIELGKDFARGNDGRFAHAAIVRQKAKDRKIRRITEACGPIRPSAAPPFWRKRALSRFRS